MEAGRSTRQEHRPHVQSNASAAGCRWRLLPSGTCSSWQVVFLSCQLADSWLRKRRQDQPTNTRWKWMGCICFTGTRPRWLWLDIGTGICLRLENDGPVATDKQLKPYPCSQLESEGSIMLLLRVSGVFVVSMCGRTLLVPEGPSILFSTLCGTRFKRNMHQDIRYYSRHRETLQGCIAARLWSVRLSRRVNRDQIGDQDSAAKTGRHTREGIHLDADTV